MNIVAIVPAAGCGRRMQAASPKQYIKIGTQTILEYTLDKLLSFAIIKQIVVVINHDDCLFTTLPVASHPKIVVTYGGATRADSVLAGLAVLNNHDWVLVHDAARPCVSHEDIKKLIDVVIKQQTGAILATRITDTIKKAQPTLNDNCSMIEATYDRRFLWAAATPQMFNVSRLRSALIKAQANSLEITDEASAMEFCGDYPLLVECRRDNIKVTQPEDLALATFYLSAQLT